MARRLWAFAYVDGAFRYLQDLRAKKPHWRLDAQPVSLDQEILESRLVSMAKPIYPQAAIRRYLQGSVKLWVVVGKDGAVKDVQVQEGVCLLSRAAVEAVKKWRYTPTLVDGGAQEAVGNVEVKFRLNSP